MKTLIKILEKFDITEVFKTKGKLKRWSAKRSIGGVIVTAAMNDIVKNGVNEWNVVLCLIGVLPLCFSFFESN